MYVCGSLVGIWAFPPLQLSIFIHSSTIGRTIAMYSLLYSFNELGSFNRAISFS